MKSSKKFREYNFRLGKQPTLENIAAAVPLELPE